MSKNHNPLNTDRLNMGLRLLKVPNHLYEQMENFEEGAEMGEMMIKSIQKENSSSRHIELLINDENNSSITKMEEDESSSKSSSKQKDEIKVNEFIVEEQRPGVPLIALNYDDIGNQYGINGSIVKRVIAKPKVTESYHDLVRKRTLESKGSMSMKTVKMLTDTEIDKNNSNNTINGFIPHLNDTHKQQKRRRGEDTGNNGPLDPKLLRKEFFDAISSSEGDMMTLKELMSSLKETGTISGGSGVGGGEKEVKELLSEYTDFHKSGPNKNYYELKQEYRN